MKKFWTAISWRRPSLGRPIPTPVIAAPATPIIPQGLLIVSNPRSKRGRVITWKSRNPDPIVVPVTPRIPIFSIFTRKKIRKEGRVVRWSGRKTTVVVPVTPRTPSFKIFRVAPRRRAGRVVRWLICRADPVITGSLNHGLIRLSNLQIFLNVKREVDSGEVDALSTDLTGTPVLFNKAFKDIDSITCTVDSVTEPYIVIYDFTDVPNPTGFSVYVFDTTGNRVSKLVSWKSRGVV